MKKLFFVALLFVGAVVAVQAQEKTVAKATAHEKGPKMVFESETIDYGKIKEGAEPYRVFKFKNVGNENLIITSARGSCGCTVPTYPEKPIEPNESAEIKVRYDTKRVGPFTKNVTITTNEKENTHVLTIKGEVLKAEEQQGVPTKAGGVFNN